MSPNVAFWVELAIYAGIAGLTAWKGTHDGVSTTIATLVAVKAFLSTTAAKAGPQPPMPPTVKQIAGAVVDALPPALAPPAALQTPLEPLLARLSALEATLAQVPAAPTAGTASTPPYADAGPPP